MSVDYDLLDAAMCAWEHVAEQARKGGNKWADYARPYGIAALRGHVAGLAATVHEAWEAAMSVGFDESFDWDFVPLFLEHATNSGCVLRSDWHEVAEKIGRGEIT